MSGLRSLTRGIMRAIRVAQFGGEEVLKLDSNVPVPQPKDNQVLIKVFAAGINPVDTYIRSGTYALKPSLPYTPGSDVSGVIESVGPGVEQYKKGDRVFTARTVSGGYAEYAVADECNTQPLGDALTFEQGAGIGVPYFTAYRAVVLVGKGKPGDTILIHGASGAVGLACVQIANSIGMKVIGTAGSQEGMEVVTNNTLVNTFALDTVKTYGVLFLNASVNDNIIVLATSANDNTSDQGPNLIIEMLANVNLETDMKLIAKKGTIVVVGNRGSIEITPRLAMMKECIITGMILFNASQEERKQLNAGIQAGMKVGWLKPHIAREYTLEQAASAHHDIIHNKGSMGKLVIKV